MARSIIAELRAVTAPMHASVEHHFAALMTDAPAVELYDRFLLAMWRFHATFEPLLDAAQGWDACSPALDRAPRRKLALLELDLAERALALPCVPELPVVAPPTFREALGIAYVVEGSTLGHRVLHRHLAPRLPLASHAFRFLGHYGDRTGEMWRALANALEAHVRMRPRDANPVVDAAIACFSALEGDLRTRDPKCALLDE